MKIIRTPVKMERWRESGLKHRSIGLVPTMGALHEGHLSLVRRSKKENRITVVSIFVNPRQFGPKEDYSRYPRTWAVDKRMLMKEGVDVVFFPAPETMYSKDHQTNVSVSPLNSVLCGAPTSRGPAHFNGVATVVAKLFNLVRPSRAYFGLKDFQQVRIIEQMSKDLNQGVNIRRCPIVREVDGLALSSRNQYLSSSERALAPTLYLALQYGRKLLRSKRKHSISDVKKRIRRILASIPRSRIEYVEAVDPTTLQPRKTTQHPVLLAVAWHIGTTRLIDNIQV